MALVKTRFSGSPRRVAILESALDRFTARGYEDTTVEEIRENCGASNGSFYHFFGSKRDVAAALFVEYSRLYGVKLAEVIAAARSARTFVTTVAEFAIRWAFEDEPVFAPVAESIFLPEILVAAEAALAPINAHMSDVLLTAYETWAERGKIRPLQGELVRSVLMGPAEAYVRQRLHAKTTVEPDEAAESLGQIAWLALRTEAERLR